MQPSNDQPTDRRVTVVEAAALLGVTPDAVRSRLRRGTLRRDEAKDGTVLVVLESVAGEGNGRDGHDQQPTDRTTDQTTVGYIEGLRSKVELLERELRDWKEEARRKDHLLAAALERIPAIEAPGSLDTPSHESSRDDRVGAEHPLYERGSPVVDEEPKSSSTGSGAKEEPQGGISEERPAKLGPWWRRWFGPRPG